MPTKEQVATLENIAAWISDYGYPPSFREIMNECGYQSTSTVHVHLRALARSGLVTYIEGQPRTIVITTQGRVLLRAKGGTHAG
jgi:repressor LexA